MKYRKYKLEFSGSQEALAKVQDIPRMWDNLGKARAAGRAAKVLYGLEYSIASILLPRPIAERVKAL